MKELWLTYDIPQIKGFPCNFMTILEDCEIDADKDGNMTIKGGHEVAPDINELKKIAKIFDEAISNLEKGLFINE